MTDEESKTELTLKELGEAVERGEREPAEAVARLKAAVVYPRFLGTDTSGDSVWELANGRWTFGDEPWSAVDKDRTFEPERYVQKYGVPTPLEAS
jgi:hypothetical protein